MEKHIIKTTHKDGIELRSPISWCGKQLGRMEWKFQDAQHALLSIENGSSIQPCKKCLKAIATILNDGM